MERMNFLNLKEMKIYIYNTNQNTIIASLLSYYLAGHCRSYYVLNILKKNGDHQTLTKFSVGIVELINKCTGITNAIQEI